MTDHMTDHQNGGLEDDPDMDPLLTRSARLPPRQVMAIRMLLAGRRIGDVAAHVGVNRHTVSAWLKQRPFQLEVRRMAMDLPLPEEGTHPGPRGSRHEGEPPEGEAPEKEP